MKVSVRTTQQRASVAWKDSSNLRVRAHAQDLLYGSHNERHANRAGIVPGLHKPQCESCRSTAFGYARLERNPCARCRGDMGTALMQVPAHSSCRTPPDEPTPPH